MCLCSRAVFPGQAKGVSHPQRAQGLLRQREGEQSVSAFLLTVTTAWVTLRLSFCNPKDSKTCLQGFDRSLIAVFFLSAGLGILGLDVER